jgi:hypothetical protein
MEKCFYIDYVSFSAVFYILFYFLFFAIGAPVEALIGIKDSVIVI